MISRTDDDEVGNTQVKALELIADDSIFGIFGAPLQYAGWADIGAAGVPLYTTFPASGDANGFDNIYVPNGTLCVDCSSPASVNGAVIAGGTKAASIGFGVSQASKDCVNRTEADFATYGPGAGVEFVYKNDDLPFGFPNGLGPEVTAMKEAGVDFITTCIDQSSVLILEQELERQGMGDVVVALPQGYSDTEFVSANAALLEGDIMGVPYRPIEADPGDSNIQTMLDAFEASGIQVNDYAIQGWFGAQLAAEGIIAAGPQFDRATRGRRDQRVHRLDQQGHDPDRRLVDRPQRSGRERCPPVLLLVREDHQRHLRDGRRPGPTLGLLRAADWTDLDRPDDRPTSTDEPTDGTADR